MAAPDNAIFRKAALERLASPERLDARPRLPTYPRLLAAALVALGIAVVVFAAWLR